MQAGPFGGWDELRAVAGAASSALVACVDGLTDDRFFIDDGEAFELTRSMLLGHVSHRVPGHDYEPSELSVWA